MEVWTEIHEGLDYLHFRQSSKSRKTITLTKDEFLDMTDELKHERDLEATPIVIIHNTAEYTTLSLRKRVNTRSMLLQRYENDHKYVFCYETRCVKYVF